MDGEGAAGRVSGWVGGGREGKWVGRGRVSVRERVCG